MSDEHLYESAAAELESGELRKGLWANAARECSGDVQLTRALYIEWRVEQLRAEHTQQAEPSRTEDARVESLRRVALYGIVVALVGVGISMLLFALVGYDGVSQGLGIFLGFAMWAGSFVAFLAAGIADFLEKQRKKRQGNGRGISSPPAR
jgi:hypothetical protein